MTPDVRVCADVHALSERVAAAAAKTINDAVRSNGRCTLALSGGSTPRTLYSLLASTFRDQIPWTRVHVFWSDERYVAAHDPDSNYHLARETLLDHVPCPSGNVHPMPTHFASPDAAARDYERTLRGYFHDSWPHIDLIVLGIGAEGHTASLFPGSPALRGQTRWVVPVTAPAEPPRRLTLTLPVLSRAATIYVLVAGAKKAGALHHALAGPPDPNACPASGVRSTAGTLIWWVDREAASRLEVGTESRTPPSGAAIDPRSNVDHG